MHSGVEIMNGCFRARGAADMWYYTQTEFTKPVVAEDYQNPRTTEAELVTYTFLGDGQGHPRIGDFIVAGKLVRRTEPKVVPTNRPDKWDDYFERNRDD